MNFSETKPVDTTPFTEKREAFGDYTKIIVLNKKTGYSIEIIPEKGAKINGLSYTKDDEVFQMIEGYNTPEETEKSSGSRSSILAPFPNRIEDGTYSHNNIQHQLPIDKPNENNSIHGFIQHEKFSVIESSQTGNSYEVLLRHESQGDKKGYPFPFTMDIVYRLTENGLETEITVTNTGNESMPFGHGWHPYFKTEGSVDELELQMSDVEKIEVDGRLIPTGKKTNYDNFVTPKQIEEIKFDTGFEFTSENREVILIDRKNNIKILVSMSDSNNTYNYVQLYIPPDRNSIAIEPMSCATNAFNNGMGLKVIEPGEKFIGKYNVGVSTIS